MARIHSSIWLGVGIILFSGLLFLFLVPTWVITPKNVQILVLSPDFWPYIVAGLLAIGGVALLAQYFFFHARAGHTEESDETAGGIARIALVGVLMVVYYLILPYIGMVIGSVIAYMAFMGIIGFPRKASSIVVAIILPLILYGFFNHMAGVPIPQADFFRLP